MSDGGSLQSADRPESQSMDRPDITLLKDSDWEIIDGEPCKVTNFAPMASISNGKVVTLGMTVPYASVTFECKKLAKNCNGLYHSQNGFRASMGGLQRKNCERE